jgi:hypothetical protein
MQPPPQQQQQQQQAKLSMLQADALIKQQQRPAGVQGVLVQGVVVQGVVVQDPQQQQQGRQQRQRQQQQQPLLLLHRTALVSRGLPRGRRGSASCPALLLLMEVVCQQRQSQTALCTCRGLARSRKSRTWCCSGGSSSNRCGSSSEAANESRANNYSNGCTCKCCSKQVVQALSGSPWLAPMPRAEGPARMARQRLRLPSHGRHMQRLHSLQPLLNAKRPHLQQQQQGLLLLSVLLLQLLLLLEAQRPGSSTASRQG